MFYRGKCSTDVAHTIRMGYEGGYAPVYIGEQQQIYHDVDDVQVKALYNRLDRSNHIA